MAETLGSVSVPLYGSRAVQIYLNNAPTLSPTLPDPQKAQIWWEYGIFQYLKGRKEEQMWLKAEIKAKLFRHKCSGLFISQFYTVPKIRKITKIIRFQLQISKFN